MSDDSEQQAEKNPREHELELQLAEAQSLIDLQAIKLNGARDALQRDQPKHALDILS
jgi:hypothetical protein